MDPNRLLADLRALAERIAKAADEDEDHNPWDATELAVRFQSLDHWLTMGGFCPSEWVKCFRGGK